MNLNYFNVLKFGALALFSMVLLTFNACNEKDTIQDPIASFQFEVSESNFLQVQFTNFSKNASSYEWDFGDGGTSTETDPTHTYAQVGTYDVKLTAINERGVRVERIEEVIVQDPNARLTALAGFTQKTWILQRQGIALGIGPSPTSTEWWSFGGVTPLGDRPCILDDEYTFVRSGQFTFDSKNTIFTDGTGNGGWNNDNADRCGDESAINFTSTNGIDMSAYKNGGNYTFELSATELKLFGAGVYIGLPNKTNDGDIGGNRSPQTQLTYRVMKLVEGAEVDSLHLSMQVSGQEIYWNFYLVSYKNEALKPAIPTAQPAADFSFTTDQLTVTFNNSSRNSTAYTWDFGDGSSSTEESPVHTYANSGEYQVKLTARNGAGVTSEITKTVGVSQATYSKDVLSSANGRVWKLAPVPGFIRVGPGIGSGEWWSPNQADVDARACMTNDEFKFFTNGDYHFDAKGDLFGEPYMGVDPAGCVNEDDLTGSAVGFKSSTSYTFTATDASGSNRPTITVNGTGAFLGFNKAFNGGEYANNTDPLKTTVTYQVISYFKNDTEERIEVSIDISGDQSGGAWWTFILTSPVQ